MKAWLIRIARTALVVGVVAVCAAGAAIWHGNRDAAPPTLAEKQESYRRAVAWMQANEGRILNDGNAALWWMVSTAAERTGDAYLKGLVRQSLSRIYGTGPARPWKRIVQPDAEVSLEPFPMDSFESYQRFFYQSVTCRPLPLDGGGDTNQFLDQGVCRPLAKTFVKDSACVTHQLMGVTLFQRSGCQSQVDLPKLKAVLLDDIDTQMRWDVIVKDSYLQRVLMLLWVGGPDRVKPVWLNRVLLTQQADGGWVGVRHWPELPKPLQPWELANQAPPTNFHATAQGLLIMALSLPEVPH